MVTKYGITLSRLTENKIELIRQWRNDPKIAQYMEFKEYITPEMQVTWFNKINNESNYFFIIEFEEKEIGLINIKEIDEKEGEAGIFIFDDTYLNSDVSFRASLCLNDFGFETLHLKRMKAHILRTNKRAIQFNKLIGYKIAENQDSILNQLYYLTKEDYSIKKERIIRLF
jgi:UDP-4-amino-4,6-dideoxy-N-acetyl-beta-L-altrosamine N-acetyltransferase